MGLKKASVSKKAAKDPRKSVEERAFGQKNKNKSGAIKKQLQRLEISESLEKKKKRQDVHSEKVFLVQQKAPVGVDPKTIPCVFFQHKMCTKGERCKYGHEDLKQAEKKTGPENANRICQFLIDSINKGEYTKAWVCPDTSCRNIHKLAEACMSAEHDMCLEEHLELLRQSLGDNLTPMTEERFLEWRARKKREDRAHYDKMKSIGKVTKGRELFSSKPEIFEDDEEGGYIDYDNRCNEDF